MEEQYLVNNVPITRVPKLLKDNEQVIDATSSAKVSEDDVTLKFPIETKHKALGISEDSSPINLSTSHSCSSELSPTSLLKKTSQQIGPVATLDLNKPCLSNEEVVIATTGTTKDDVKNVEGLEITVDIPQTKQSRINVEKHAKELSTASEIVTVSPVPIQVAESVLQMEPKESVSDSQVIPQEVLSSTITPVHITKPDSKLHTNDSTSMSTDTVNILSELPKKSVEVSQISESVEPIQSSAMKTSQSTKSENKESETCPIEITKSTVETTSSCAKEITESTMEITSSCPKEIESAIETTLCYPKKMQESPIETTSSCPKEIIESGVPTTAEGEKSETSESTKTPVRPSRVKDLGTSASSTSTGMHQEKGQEKTIKKTVKKSTEKSISEGEPTETTDGDSTGRKVTKKVVKKVPKKTKTKSEEGLDDGTENSSSASKCKKVVKVVKKGTKSLQTATSDPTDPETPSSSTSDTPVPPKRKTKITASKTATKKSDTDQ